MKALNQGRQCMPGSVGRECIYEHFSPIYRQTGSKPHRLHRWIGVFKTPGLPS